MNIGVILAGGTGTRVGGDIPKQFIEFNGKTVLEYTIEIFEKDENINYIEVVCHKDWISFVSKMCEKHPKVKWICNGGDSFQESTMNGIFNLKGRISPEDIVVVSFGTAPMTPQEDIDDSIRVCKEHGNAIASQDIVLSTCIKDDEFSTTQNLARETLKGFANPWTFIFGEVLEAYEYAVEKDLLKDLEPHTTTLYLALGKRLWFSQSTSQQAKITYKTDLDQFEGYLLLQEKRKKEHNR